MAKLKIELNGTDNNPYHRFGLTQNPFPQLPKAEISNAVLRLQSLGGDPITDTDYIRSKLRGFISDELIDLCCQRFVKGEFIRFTVTFEE